MWSIKWIHTLRGSNNGGLYTNSGEQTVTLRAAREELRTHDLQKRFLAKGPAADDRRLLARGSRPLFQAVEGANTNNCPKKGREFEALAWMNELTLEWVGLRGEIMREVEG